MSRLTQLNQKRRGRRSFGAGKPNAQPSRKTGSLTLPAETAGPTTPASIRPVIDLATGAAPPLLPAARDPAGPLKLPKALANSIPDLPPLGTAGRVQRAIALLSALTSFKIPELAAFDATTTARPAPSIFTAQAAPSASQGFKQARKSQTAIGRAEPEPAP